MSANPNPAPVVSDLRRWLHSIGVSDTAITEFGIAPLDEAINKKIVHDYRKNYATLAVAYPCMTTTGKTVYRVRQQVEPKDDSNVYSKRHMKTVSPKKPETDEAIKELGELFLYGWAAGKLRDAVKAANGVLNLFEGEKSAWVHFSLTGALNVSAIFGSGNAKLLPTDILKTIGVTQINFYADHDEDDGKEKGAGYKAAWHIWKRCTDAGIECHIYWLKDLAKSRDGFDTVDLAKDLSFVASDYQAAFKALPEMPADELMLYAPPPPAPHRSGESWDTESLFERYIQDVVRSLERRDGRYASRKNSATVKAGCPCGVHTHGETNAHGRISWRNGFPVFLCDVQGSVSWQEIGKAVNQDWEQYKTAERFKQQQDRVLDDAGLTRLVNPKTAEDKIRQFPATTETPAASTTKAAEPLKAPEAPSMPPAPLNIVTAPPKTESAPAPILAQPALYDQALEEHLLGNILRVPKWCKRLKIEPKLFGYSPAQVTAVGITKLMSDGIDITYTGVCAKLRELGFMENVGEAWLKKIHDGAHDDQQTQALFDQVSELAFRREIKAGAPKLTEIADNIHINRDGRLGRIQNLFNDLMGKTLKRDVSVSDIAASIRDYNEEKIFNPDKVRGIATPYNRLTNVLGGLKKGRYMVIGAFTSNGKTTLMFNLGAHALLKERKPNGEPYRILFVSLEMTEDDVVEAFMNYPASMPVAMPEWVKGLSPAQQEEQLLWMDVLSRTKEIAKYENYLHITNANTPAKIRAKIEEIRTEYGEVDMVFVDYLQLMTADKPSGNKTLDIETISRDLKLIANEYKIHVTTATQYPKDASGRDLEDASKWASGIIQDADVVLQIYSETGKSTEGRFVPIWGDVEFRVTKIRKGLPAVCLMTFYRESGIFAERQE